MLDAVGDSGRRQQVAGYLASQPAPQTVVDWLCWLHGVFLLQRSEPLPPPLALQLPDRLAGAADFLRQCRGGACYADRPGGPAGPYFTMLALLAMELIDELAGPGRPTLGLSAVEDLIHCLLNHRTADGGFAESAGAGGTAQANPTAAALVALSRLGLADNDTIERAAIALAVLQDESGGIRAHAAAPMADLLSTFTVLEALRVTQQLSRLRLGGIGRFVRSLALPEGGFRGVATGGSPDAEYTFYGLAALSLLAVSVDR